MGSRIRKVVFIAVRENHGPDITTMSDTMEECQIFANAEDMAEPDWAIEHPVFKIIPIVEEFEFDVNATH